MHESAVNVDFSSLIGIRHLIIGVLLMIVKYKSK